MRHAQRRQSFEVLALAAVLAGTIPLVLHLAVRREAELVGAYNGWTLAIYLLAAGGTASAAWSFGRADPMRPGWVLLCVSYLLLAPGRILGGSPDPASLSPVAATMRAGVGLASGWLAFLGFLELSRAWRSTDLDATSPRLKLALRIGALLLAVLLTGPELLDRLPVALRGEPLAMADVASDALDIALLVVAVPVLRAALAMGGGLIAWPWAFLTMSLLAWLGYDAVNLWGGRAGYGTATLLAWEDAFCSLAAGFAFAAGVTQYRVVRMAPGHQ
jgi:hypothetical protein